jgi:hypothetical protein
MFENDALSRRRTWKTLQDTARLCKEREVIFSEFCGGVVQLVRTSDCHAGGRLFESVAPAILGSPIYRVRGAHWRFFAVAVHNPWLPQQIPYGSLADLD